MVDMSGAELRIMGATAKDPLWMCGVRKTGIFTSPRRADGDPAKWGRKKNKKNKNNNGTLAGGNSLQEVEGRMPVPTKLRDDMKAINLL